MFQADFDVLLYDLTSTYFECDPPEAGKRKHGYSRDKRPDCVQVVIALVITPDGPHRVHVGDVVEESDGDLMGDGVSVAARGGGRRAGRPLPFRGRWRQGEGGLRRSWLQEAQTGAVVLTWSSIVTA